MNENSTELTLAPNGLERLHDTLNAYAIVLANTAGKRGLAALRQLPDYLEDGENLLALAWANVKRRGGCAVALTSKRLLLINQTRPDRSIALDPGELRFESLGHGAMWGNTMKVWAGQDELVFRQFAPTSEAVRIATTLGWPIPEERFRALPKGWNRDPKTPPIAGMWEISIYPDRMVDHQGNHLPFDGDVQALADAAGDISVTRGRNLAAKGAGTLAFGPIGMLFMGNAKNRQVDNRELYLLVEGSRWAYTQKFNPNLGQALRQFAGQINAAARDYRAAVAPEPAAPSSVSGVAQELRELASLRDEGILTEEEFAAQKAKLLGS